MPQPGKAPGAAAIHSGGVLGGAPPGCRDARHMGAGHPLYAGKDTSVPQGPTLSAWTMELIAFVATRLLSFFGAYPYTVDRFLRCYTGCGG